MTKYFPDATGPQTVSEASDLPAVSCACMKIQFRAIGKNHEPHFKAAIDMFSDRIRHYFPVEWKIIAPPKAQNMNDARMTESKLLLHAQPGDTIVALDERGKQMNSPKLAQYIEEQSIRSSKTLVFAIGGAYGFDQQLIKNADLILGLSDLTFPHQLVRLILAEQVYRACTIIRGEKYHHS